VKHKNDQQPGWEIVYTCGGCDADDWIEEAFNAWRVANKTQIFVGRISLTPSNVSRKIAEFKARNLRTLQLHPAQIVRFMCLQGSYVLSAEMVATGAITEQLFEWAESLYHFCMHTQLAVAASFMHCWSFT
jgi:hypothetical protein